jgi:hypothetical protein
MSMELMSYLRLKQGELHGLKRALAEDLRGMMAAARELEMDMGMSGVMQPMDEDVVARLTVTSMAVKGKVRELRERLEAARQVERRMDSTGRVEADA